MKRKIIAIFSVIFIILVLVCTGIVMQLNKRIVQNPEGTVGNTAGNLYNGGLFCEDDGYVYFSNPYDNYALYRMKPNETELEKLIGTETGSINAAGKYIYFYQKGSGSGEGFGYVISTTGVYRAEKENPHNINCLDRVLSENIVLADNRSEILSPVLSAATVGIEALMCLENCPTGIGMSSLSVNNKLFKICHHRGLLRTAVKGDEKNITVTEPMVLSAVCGRGILKT